MSDIRAAEKRNSSAKLLNR